MYQIPELLKYPKLFHAFSTIEEGNMANSILGKVRNFNEVVKNRERFLSKFGITMDSCICIWVQHKDEVIVADKKTAGISIRDYKFAVKVDGLVTDKKELYLFLLVADCLPIIIYDPKKNIVGNIHAGWKGVDLEIAKKAIKRMRTEFGTNPVDVVVGIGPCARRESFIKENPGQKDDPKWQPYMNKVGPYLYEVDLAGFTKKQLIDCGVAEENIFDCNVDTIKDDRFFSHFRDKEKSIHKQGRFASIVGISLKRRGLASLR